MASQLLGIKTRFTNDLGSPLVGGQVYTYFAGTSTNQDSYSDAALTVPNTNPVILDDTGSADIFLKGSYRIRVFGKSGRFIEEQDNVTQAASQGDATELNSKIDAQKLDTGITATAKFGGVERTQADKNSDFVSIKDFATLAEAQAAAIENSIKVFIPTGEHEYDLTNADMTLFWGYGQLKDSATGATYKPMNGDFVTPQMFGIKEKIDETAKLSAMFNYAAINKLPVIFSKSAEYHFDEILIKGEDISVNWRTDNNVKVVLKCIRGKISGSSADMYAIKIAGVALDEYPVVQDVPKGTDVVKFSPTTSVSSGDLLIVSSTKLVPSESRGWAVVGMVNQVRKQVSPTSYATTEMFYENMRTNLSWTVAVTEVISNRVVKLEGLDASPDDVESLLVFNTGVLADKERGLVEWDNTTKIATFHGTQADISGVVVGDTVTIRNTTTVTHVKPVEVSITGNIHLTKDEKLDYVLGSRGQRGLYIEYARDAILRGLTIENFPYTNLLIDLSYNTLVDGMVNHGANNSYNGYDGTGYGISCSSSTHTTVQNSKFARCRRGIDFTGLRQAAAWFSTVKNCHYTGGGLSYTGMPFFPSTVEGVSTNSGFGNHGGAYYTTFDSCTVSYAYSGFVVRGVDTTIVNCTQYGKAHQCVGFSQQRGCVIDNYTYQDKTSNLSASSPSGGATYFAQLYATNQGLGSVITIKNCNITSLNSTFIKVERSGTLPAFIVENNDVRIAPPNTISNFYKLSINASPDGTLFKIANSLFKNNRFIDTKNYIQTVDNYTTTAAVLEKSSYFESSAYKERILLPALETTKILLREAAAGIELSMLPINRGRTYFLQNSVLYFGRGDTDVSPNALNNKTDIVLSSTIPTGTIQDNKLTIAYAPDGGVSVDRYRALYIYNGFDRDEAIMLDVVLL